MQRRNSKISNNMNMPNFQHGRRESASGTSNRGGLNRMNSILSGARREHRINSIASNQAKK